MLPLLLIIFIVVPIAELAVIIQVGQEIGVWWTIAILIADSMLGALLMRSQGRVAWRRFNEALAAGRLPAREVLDGVLVIFGGALLLTPGLHHRHLRRAVPAPADARDRAAAAGAARRATDDRGGAGAGAGRRAARGRPGDVDGTAVDIEPEHLPRQRRRASRCSPARRAASRTR